MTENGMAAVKAPMVGRVVDVVVEPGARVAANDELLILESMKMEVPVVAPRDGVVEEIRVGAGDTVQEEDLLILLR